jgi:hypothetical protein
MINDVSDAFAEWKETIVGTRFTGSYVDGRWVQDFPSVLSFEGVVQNAEPEDLKVLPEAFRTEESLKIHTTFELVVQVSDTTTGDLIFYDSNVWRVYNVADRKIGNYYKVILKKE